MARRQPSGRNNCPSELLLFGRGKASLLPVAFLSGSISLDWMAGSQFVGWEREYTLWCACVERRSRGKSIFVIVVVCYLSTWANKSSTWNLSITSQWTENKPHHRDLFIIEIAFQVFAASLVVGWDVWISGVLMGLESVN